MKVIPTLLAAGLLFAATAAADTPPSAFCKISDRDYDEYDKLPTAIGRPLATFGMKLLQGLAQSSKEPALVVSPYSVAAALGMALVGARGQTAQELAEGLARKGVPTGGALKLEAAFTRRLACPRARQTTEVRSANRLYVKKSVKLEPVFVKELRETYDVSVGELDGQKDARKAVKEINAWVARQTDQKIKDLLAGGAITPATKLLLVNATHVRGAWAHEFPLAATKPRDFYTGPKKTVKTSMMQATGWELPYAERKGYRALMLPFKDGDASLVVLVPGAVDGLPALLAALDGTEIDAMLKALVDRRVNVALPKFKVESTATALVATLKSLGIRAAFEPQADFSGIDGGANQLVIGDVAHKAFIDVDEKGLEAAAATGVSNVKAVAPRPKPGKVVEFVVDRPFVFLVVHRATNALLFAGRLVKP